MITASYNGTSGNAGNLFANKSINISGFARLNIETKVNKPLRYGIYPNIKSGDKVYSLDQNDTYKTIFGDNTGNITASFDISQVDVTGNIFLSFHVNVSFDVYIYRIWLS